MSLIHTYTREDGDGRKYQVELYEDDNTPPWEREDGHGPVSGWTGRDKFPGELVLSEVGHTHYNRTRRYYDYAEACRIALRAGWGVQAPAGKTKRQIAAQAAREGFERLRAWCDGDWSYIGVVVTPHPTEGDPEPRSASLWGIESDADDYIAQVVEELIDECKGAY